MIEKLAAGEVINSTKQALKELIENSIDAGASDVGIKITLNSITVTDNGSGIARSNFELLCARFATSKLEKFEFLQSVKTYGFRGEALSSISYCSSTLEVQSFHNGQCTIGHFQDGKLVQCESFESEEPNGTRIFVVFADMQNNFKEILQMFNQLIIQYSDTKFSIEYAIQGQKTFK